MSNRRRHGSGAAAQASREPSPVSADISVTDSAEESQLAPGNSGCFWFRGAGADAGFTLRKGVAGALTGEHVNQAPGMSIDKIAYVLGPRYTFCLVVPSCRAPAGAALRRVPSGRCARTQQHLPTAIGLTSSATSFAMQTGGGINAFVSKRFALRAIEVKYLRTIYRTTIRMRRITCASDLE